MQRHSPRKKPKPIRKSDGSLIEASISGATKIVIVGIGSELRGDDAAGVLVARAISKRTSHSDDPHLIAIDGGTAPENVTSEIIRACPSHVVLIDTADMNLAPGEARIIRRSEIGGTSFSTHSLPLGVIIDYLERSITCEVVVVGIQPRTTEFGAKISPAVQRTVKAIVEELSTTL